MKALAHHAGPQTARGTKLRHFFQQVVVCIEEKRDARCEVVNREAGIDCRVYIRDGICEGESDFLDRGRTCLANVITADSTLVPARRLTRAERKRVGDQAAAMAPLKNVVPRAMFPSNCR